MLKALALVLLIATSTALAAQPAQLQCDIGPATRTYGAGQWFVYACSDDRSVILVSSPENPASPFLFTFIYQDNAYQLTGRGTGDQAASAAALEQLKALSRDEIEQLLAAAKAKAPGSSHPRFMEAVNFAAAWIDLFDAGDEKATFAQLTPAFQANLTAEQWQRAVQDSGARLGTRLSRKLRRVVWYQDPSNAPLPGLYAAVEFDSVFQNAEKHFRYVILHSQDGAPFKVMRTEADVRLNR